MTSVWDSRLDKRFRGTGVPLVTSRRSNRAGAADFAGVLDAPILFLVFGLSAVLIGSNLKPSSRLLQRGKLRP